VFNAIRFENKTVFNFVCFLLGNSPASEFYIPTFRNTLSLPASQAGGCRMTRFEKCSGIITQHFSNLVILHLPAHEDGTDYSETSAYKIQTPGNYLRRKNTRTLMKLKKI